TGLIELAFDKLAVSAKLEDKVNFNLSDILGTSLNIKLNKIFDPKLSFEVSDLQINQFLLRTDVTQKDDLVRMEGALSLDSFNLNNDIYGPLIFKMSADHIHGKLLKLLKDYLADLTKQELTVDEWQDKLLAYIRGPAAGLFTDNPEFNIKQIYLRMPDGEVKVSGSMKFEGLDVNDLSDFSALINKSKASFDYSLPEILAINVFEKQVIGLLITDQEVISEQDMKNVLETTKYLVKGFINSYASMNYINFANGIISGSIRLEQGKMYLNGVEYQNNQTDIDSIYSEEDDRLLQPEVPAFEDDYPEDESISSPEPQNNNRNNNRVQTQEDGSSSNLDAIF
ncbi:MAG: YdgA family protein, partial [Neisseriaceae bacterium]|nr:YdgA family protein [Neisseriaceae bacterium]